MGLHQNGFRDNVGVFRYAGLTASNGAIPSALNINTALTGAMRNITAGEGITSDKVGIPLGYLAGGSWVMPQKAGNLSSHNNADFAISIAGLAVGGITTTASASIDITAEATGSLIASGEGTATFDITTNTPLLTASINGVGESTFAITMNTPTLGAIASMEATASFSITASLTPYAIGIMEGTTEESGLTNAGIANSVWGKVIEAGYTADEMLRILTSFAAGSATGLEGANPQFTGLDGSTLRIDGTYSAGTRTIDALNGA